MQRLATLILFTLFLFLVTGYPASASDSPDWWQLVFAYSENGLVLQQATPIGPSAKALSTPGLANAPITCSYEAEWTDQAGAFLMSSQIQMPLGMRTAPFDGEACEMFVPRTGIVVVRVIGPSQSTNPISLRLTMASAPISRRPDLPLPDAFSYRQITLPIAVSLPKPVTGPIGVTKLRDTGPDSNRLVIVVLSDGYTAASLSSGLFTSHTNTLLSAFTATPPWDVMFEGTNVYRIDVESNENGADHDPYGTFKDTYFNSSFWVEGIERLLAVDDVGYYRAIAAADALVGPGLWDEMVVQVNSTKYGGSGGSISVVSAHSAGPQVVLHELGHTFGGLADEYTTPYPGFPPGDPEPNVDYDNSGPNLKWLAWVEPGTPLPTPDISTWYNVVGTFEGARYLTAGIYRPSHNCLMRSLGVPLDPVCKEFHLRGYFSRTRLIDNAIPADGATSLVPSAGANFVVDPIPFAGLQYEWKIEDSVLAVTDSAITLTWEQFLAKGGQAGDRLILTITYPTTLMRLSQESEQYSWALQPDCNGNGVADPTDISSHTSADANHNGIPDECDNIICCEGTTGNVNLSGNVDLSDLATLIAYMTITPRPTLLCESEANINASGSIDLSDLSLLVSYLVTTPKPSLPACP